MRRRCKDPRDPAYPNYGGRGIKVCAEWESADAFVAWAMESGWSSGLTIDRVDVDGNYEPANCRWATSSQQAENVRLLTAANVSGYRGVSRKHGRDVWLARITVRGGIVHLGHHATAEAAARARDAYVVSSGLGRPLNFPLEIEARRAERAGEPSSGPWS